MPGSDLIISQSALARLRPWAERLTFAAGVEGAVWVDGPAKSSSGGPIYYHRHPELEANLVLNGTGTYLIKRALVPLDPGTLIWLFPGQDHLMVRRSADLRMHIVVWRPGLVAATVGNGAAAVLCQADPAGAWASRPPPARFRALVRLADEVAREQDPPAVNAGLGWLLMRCWRDHRGADPVADAGDLHPSVARVAHLLREDSLRQRTVPGLAKMAGMSADHLARLFRRQIGVSLTAYRNQCCLARFLDRARPGHGCLKLALDCGFGSYPHFHRIFRAAMGTSPGRWLRER